jgi:hypothetical protein
MRRLCEVHIIDHQPSMGLGKSIGTESCVMASHGMSAVNCSNYLALEGNPDISGVGVSNV